MSQHPIPAPSVEARLRAELDAANTARMRAEDALDIAEARADRMARLHEQAVLSLAALSRAWFADATRPTFAEATA